MLQLADLFQKLGEANRALGVISEVYPMIIQNTSLIYRGRANLIRAKCLINLHNGLERAEEISLQQSYRHQILQSLDSSIAALRKAQANKELKEAYYMQAVFASRLGDVTARDSAASMFRQLCT